MIHPCTTALTEHPVWGLWGAVAALLVTRWAAMPILELQERGGWVRVNRNGRMVPRSLGVVLPLAASIAVVVASGSVGPWPPAYPALFMVSAAGLFGLMDDALGNAHQRGWRHHVPGFVTGKWTSGSLKLVGIGGASLATAVVFCGPIKVDSLFLVVVAGGIIASAANVWNLLDTRPGRSLLMFLLLAIPLGMVAPVAGTWLLPVAVSALVLLPVDLAEKGMLGDAGANALGAAWGVGLVMAQPEPLLMWGMFFGLLVLQWLGDRWSWDALLQAWSPMRTFAAWGQALSQTRRKDPSS